MRNRYNAGTVMVGAIFVALAGQAAQSVPSHAQVAKPCIFKWAVPGAYTVSGNFRGRVESAGARLTHDCKVVMQIPGVFSGGPVRRAGRCLSFRFKVHGESRIHRAKWCNTYGIVPWKGRAVRARVTRVSKALARPRVKTNFNTQSQ